MDDTRIRGSSRQPTLTPVTSEPQPGASRRRKPQTSSHVQPEASPDDSWIDARAPP